MALATIFLRSFAAPLNGGGFPPSFYIIHGAAILLLCALAVLMAFHIRLSKKAGRKLEYGNKLLLSFINAENDFIYLKDENYKYVIVNEAYARFCGRRPEELIGHDDYELFEKPLADIRRKTDTEALDGGRLTENIVDYRGNTSVITKFPVTLSNGRRGLGAHIRDITKERKHDKNQAKLLQRAGILIHLTSHEFKSAHEQLSYVLQQAVELTESKYGYIIYYDEDAKAFTPGLWSASVIQDCKIGSPSMEYPLDCTGLWGEAVRRRTHIIINDFESNPDKKGYPDEHIELKRFMSAPIVIDGRIVAVVGMANKEEDYEESDAMNLIMVVGGAWQAIQRKDVQEQLHYERNRYLQTLISIGDGVMITDETGTVEMLNGVAQKLTGWTSEEARGRPYREVFRLSHEDPSLTVEDPVEKVLKTGRIHELGNHAILTSRSGRTYYLEDSAAPIFGDGGVCEGVVLVFRDITQKREQRKKIEYLSYHDQLTGLFNRSFFEEELTRLDTERNLPISILMGDVNGLKLTNDIFGHVYGDELLKTLASVFRRTCRADDIIARWGGDEFVILLPKTSKKDAEGIAMRIRDDFASRQVRAIKGSISMGIACKTSLNQDISGVLGDAEELMYSVKTLERDSVTDEEICSLTELFYRSNPNEESHSKRVLELCEMIGAEMGLSGVELRRLKEAAYYHDIGKIIMQPEVINYKRPPSEQELADLKKHPVVGYRILNSSDRTVGLAEVVLAHHEHWNGQGYPKGLTGEEIPLLARIIAVAERYDRLKNSYDKSEADNAADIIKSEAGTLLDPQIVRILLGIIHPHAAN